MMRRMVWSLIGILDNGCEGAVVIGQHGDGGVARVLRLLVCVEPRACLGDQAGPRGGDSDPSPFQVYTLCSRVAAMRPLVASPGLRFAGLHFPVFE